MTEIFDQFGFWAAIDILIIAFIIYHILDLTTGTFNPVGDSSRPHANVIADFAPERWYVTLARSCTRIAGVGSHCAT